MLWTPHGAFVHNSRGDGATRGCSTGEHHAAALGRLLNPNCMNPLGFSGVPRSAPLRHTPKVAPGLVLAGLALQVPACAPPQRRATFTNPIFRGADPWVVRHESAYVWCAAYRDAIHVGISDRLTARGTLTTVWRAPRGAWNSREVWAPELHRLAGRWFIYYAASDGRNANHRVGVLESLADDPLGPYVDRGPLYTGDDATACAVPYPAEQDPHWRGNRWAIDATVLERDGRLYLLWSGWPAEQDVQYLYIAPLEHPWLVGGPRVRICDNTDFAWERVQDDARPRGLHEGPAVLRRGGRVFVAYSCSGAWLPTYKLGLLELTGPDPLDPAAWRKHPEPVFAPTADVHGVGHACFTKSPDGREDWIVYHAKLKCAPGWERAVCTQPFGWTPTGFPDFGQPLPWGTPVPAPAGEPAPPAVSITKPRRARPSAPIRKSKSKIENQ